MSLFRVGITVPGRNRPVHSGGHKAVNLNAFFPLKFGEEPDGGKPEAPG